MIWLYFFVYERSLCSPSWTSVFFRIQDNLKVTIILFFFGLRARRFLRGSHLTSLHSMKRVLKLRSRLTVCVWTQSFTSCIFLLCFHMERGEILITWEVQKYHKEVEGAEIIIKILSIRKGKKNLDKPKTCN